MRACFAVSRDDPTMGVTEFDDEFLHVSSDPGSWMAALEEDWTGMDAAMEGEFLALFKLIDAPIEVMWQQIRAEETIH